MPHNRGTRRKPNFVGAASYKGRRKWVSGCASVAEYNEALKRARNELREQVENPDAKRVPTCIEFAGAVIGEDGRISMVWPDGQRCQKQTGRRDSSVERMRQALKPFLLEFSERPIDSFSRDEALTWILPKSQHVQQSVRQFFNHAKDRELIRENKFARTGASKATRRVERPDFEIVTDEQYERILHCARTSRADDYTVVIEGIVLCVGEAAIRPSEIFALHKESVDLDADVIEVRWQIDSRTRKRVPVKDEDVRLVVPSPRLRAHLELIMQEPRTILFPAVRGGYMTRPNWYVYWNAVRASAGLPKLEFYELKHRALQWMIDPVNDDGLGLDHATAAEMAGHADGGWLIANVYTKLHQRRALDRAHRAMSEYAARHPAEEAQRPTARRPTNSRSATASAKNQRPVAVTAATLITYAETKPKTSVAGWTAGGTVTRRKHAGLNVHVNMS